MNGRWAILVLAAVVLSSAAAQEPMEADKTISLFEVPEGFSVKLFAGEPDIRQPIGFCIDDRARLWVIEGDSYPAWKEGAPKDRVYVFEDEDGDGKFDTRKLFIDGLTYATGIEVGFGGVWIIAPPNLLFYPDADGDDKPDGPPRILLDGFGIHGGHNVVNGFTWGPDGWLYGGHGRTSISDIGKPGTPLGKRIHFDGGVYRYHPTKHIFEPFADGTTNPWGVGFNDYGQAFISNCVNPHLYHAVQGAHFEPWRGRPSSQFAYRRIDTIADHLHFASGKRKQYDASEVHLKLGGGHAHSGAMVYLGDSWPDRYRGTMFMSNLHGHRLNNDILKRKGSGYVATHGPDFMVGKDPMFVALKMQYGPDGSVYVTDWYDRGECHTREPHRGTGRIYKVVYKDTPAVKVDLARLSDAELVKLQLHKNDWFVTHARRVLQERAAKRPIPEVHEALRAIFRDHPDVTRKLRALWALHATGALSAANRLRLLGHKEEHVRAWAIQFELEDRELPDEPYAKFVEMAGNDPSPVVRLYLAAGCRRLPGKRRGAILRGLVSHPEDVDDPNLPLMIWYAAEPLVRTDRPRAILLMKDTKIPLIREFMARRLASAHKDIPVVNVASMGATGDGVTDDAPAFQAAIDKISETGGRVLVPWGVRPYLLKSGLTLSADNVEIWGPGARLNLADGAGAGKTMHVIAIKGTPERPVRNVRIEGIRIDANYWAQPGAKRPRGIQIDWATGVTIENVQIRRAWVGLTFGRGTTNSEARDVRISRWHNDGFSVSADGDQGSTHHIRFVNCTASGSRNGDRGGMAGNRNNAWEIEDGCTDVELVDCVADNADGTGFGVRNHPGGRKDTRNIRFLRCKATRIPRGWVVHGVDAENTVSGIRLQDCISNSESAFFQGGNVEIVGGTFTAPVLAGMARGRKGMALRSFSASGARFQSLTINLPDGAGARLEGVTVEKEFRVYGDRSRLAAKDCRLPQ